MWIRHCYNKVHVFLVLKIGMVHRFHTSCALKNILKIIMQPIYIVLIDQIVNFHLCTFYRIYIYIYIIYIYIYIYIYVYIYIYIYLYIYIYIMVICGNIFTDPFYKIPIRIITLDTWLAKEAIGLLNLNSFVKEFPIIFKPVYWFALQISRLVSIG